MKENHKILFEPYQLAGCTLKNRYVMAAMGTGGMVTAENTFNERGIEYYVARAKGGVGLIITGTIYAENDIEKAVDGTMPCPTDNPSTFIMNTAEMCERVHAYGSKIFTQLTAGFGRVLKPHLLCGQPPIAPSPISSYWDENLMCRELTVDEIHTIVERCGDTAKICQQAGFDGIEIHAVHEGYLLDQFAIPFFNKRTDEYGGCLENRLRFACEVVQNIKKKCGEKFPVILRYCLKSYIKGVRQGGLPGEEFEELGRDIPEGIEAAKILVKAGYDALDVDAGAYDSWYWSHPPMYFEKGMNLPFGEILKKEMDVPILIAGRMENPDLASEALRDGKTDLIALGRSLLADPDTVNKIRSGRFEFVRPCLGCHEGYMNRLITAKPVSCAVNPSCGRETYYDLKPACVQKKILIIGAGVAGMEAARVLKLRGHSPVILEKSSRPGGSLHLAGAPSFKHDDLKLIDWYQRTLEEMGVEIHYNTAVTAETLKSYPHDAVIVATGSTPRTLRLPGNHDMYPAERIFSGEIKPGSHTVIIGGGLVGCELALDLAENGKQVTILEALPEILSAGAPVPHMNKIMLKDLLHFHHVQQIAGAGVKCIEGNTVTYTKDGEEHKLDADTFVCAIGYTSNNSLYEQLSLEENEIYLLGDARRVRNIMYAVWDAYELARSL